MYLLNIKLSTITKRELLNKMISYLEDGLRHHIVTTNPEFIVESLTNSKFREVLNNSDISLIDGVGILVGIAYAQCGTKYKQYFLSLVHFVYHFFQVGFLKRPVSYEEQTLERVSGVDLVLLLVQQEWIKGRKIYLLGGSNNVAMQAMRRLQQINPDIQFRSSNGVRDIREKNESENAAVIADINNFNPDVLLVAYGHPWQDLWISEFSSQLRFRIAIGVGGTFDYLSGRVPRAPYWLRKIGLEWLYRLFKEPRRFKRIWNATWVFMQNIIHSDSALS